ncbi:MAG: Hsp33 family molecular chaperone [Beijerinckiaceae bacterium]|nr:Hsp33 family molecular chaperone [Beijerinckiaceae bacterium]MDO9441368.1 Hsp33 family molecular chaperone [Beijerinckiaceae bacterium]
MNEAPIRPVSDNGRDDVVIPFVVEPLETRGRVVRLGPSVDAILNRHGYPEPVARLVGEAAALTVLLGSSLKFEGRFQVQTRTDGVIDLLVVDFDAPDRLRAFARFDAAALDVALAEGRSAPAQLLGTGHLALTIDQGADMSRYQGVVALEGQGLEEAAHQYFRQSEQIPTVVRLAVAESIVGSEAHWRAGGLIVQFLPDSPERRRLPDLSPGDAPEGAEQQPHFAEDDAWNEARSLAATVEDHELVDPTLSSERLLYRLFHERGVRVFDPQEVQEACRCSRERISDMLTGFTPQERRDMIGDDGKIGVTCEFCSTHREFDPQDFDPQDRESSDTA